MGRIAATRRAPMQIPWLRKLPYCPRLARVVNLRSRCRHRQDRQFQSRALSERVAKHTLKKDQSKDRLRLEKA
jgi:hypothetical protein